MGAIALFVVGLAAFLTGYRICSRYIARRVYRLDPEFVTPAHQFEDGVDYVPTNRHVLFGHHFTSVAGAAPRGGSGPGGQWRPTTATGKGCVWASRRREGWGRGMGGRAGRFQVSGNLLPSFEPPSDRGAGSKSPGLGY